MERLPASSFSAGPALERGRELTAEEEHLFRRRRRVQLATLITVILGVPGMLYLMAYGATRPEVDFRTRNFASGAKEVEAEYVGGARHGSYADYYQNGELKSVGAYDDDLENGSWEYFYWNGVRKAEGEWYFGVHHGTWRHYHSDGSIKSALAYDRGVRVGMWRSYYPGGQLEAEQPYEDGYVHGTERAFYENGTLGSVVDFRHGLEQGPAHYFHDNGAKLAEGEYLNGRKQGVWRGYDKAGDLIAVERYDRGVIMDEEMDGDVTLSLADN